MKSLLLSKKRLPVLLHILAWSIIVIIPHYLIQNYGDGDNHQLVQLYSNMAIYGLLFYLNYLWLVPKFFFRDNKLGYFLIASGLIIVLYAFMWYLNEHVFFDAEREQQFQKLMEEISKSTERLKPPIKQFRIYNYFYTSILITGFSLGLGVLEKLAQNEQQRKELEKEKLNSELAFLKNQISPHFFFNTLNNIYSLIGIDQSEAQGSVHKLSKLMRYLLYESEQTQAELSDEIDFMNHYIDLMKLRLSNKVKLSVSLPEESGTLAVPPLLFIPFVENAFKHGVSYREPSFISITMFIDGKTVNFTTKNSIGASTSKDEQHSGIGLENVKKRLNLLYPDTHRLKIEEHAGEFTVELQLEAKTIG